MIGKDVALNPLASNKSEWAHSRSKRVRTLYTETDIPKGHFREFRHMQRRLALKKDHPMATIGLRELLKRHRLLVNLVHSARELWYKWGGGMRTNYKIVNELAAFSPSSTGTLKAREIGR